MHVATHVCTTPHLPLVVWGPTGCGKSKGIEVLLKHMGFTLVSFDGVDGENAHELLQWVTRSRQTTNGHPKVTLLDDFESFTPTARASFAVELRKRDPALSGLLITCTHFRDPAMRTLASCGVVDVRLRTPQRDVIHEHFAATHGHAAMTRMADLCAYGDLRRVSMALRMPFVASATAPGATLPISSSFEATRRLLLRRIPTHEWLRATEERDVALLQEHLLAHSPDMDAYARAADSFSLGDAMQPRNYELRGLPHAAWVAAQTTRLTSRARDVGALAPRRSLPSKELAHRTSRRGTETTGPSPRPLTREVWRDMPALLRDQTW